MPLAIEPQVPYVEEARIHLDAHADDPAWATAGAMPAMTVFQPHPGAAPTGHTDVRVLSDATHLYLLFEVTDPEPERVRAALGRRDTRFADDFVGVYLDAAGTGERAYLLLVNPLGVQMDGIRTAQGDDDIAWDGRWDARGARTDSGYTVEMAIPWSTVRHPRDVAQLGLVTLRQVARTGEKSSWPAIDPAVQGVLSQQAVVSGPGVLPRDPGLDLLPELTFGWTELGPVERTLGVQGVSPGLTVRWRPTPESTLLATVNPDFSQVESDAAQVGVNRRFALSFQEKRPFFVDGSEWFAHPFGDLLYTRSMVSPLGGARATVEGTGWTAGAVSVLDEAPAPSVSEGGGWTESDLEGHQAVASVARARLQAGDGHVGLFASDKTVLGTDLANRLLAVDGRTRVGKATTLQGAAVGSHTTFADGRAAIAPAGSVALDHGGRTVYAGQSVRAVAPDFRAENGFVVDADRVGGDSWAGAVLRPGIKAVPQLWLTPAAASYGWTTRGALRNVTVDPNVRARLGNGANAAVGASVGGEAFADAWLPTKTGWAELGGAWTQWLEGGVGGRAGLAPIYDPASPRSGRVTSAATGLTLRPFPAFSVGTQVGGERMVEADTDAVVYEGAVARVRGELFFSRRVWMRSIADVSTFDDRRSAEVLGAWEVGPGQGVYVGGRAADGGTEGGTWTAFSKVSWTL